MMYIDYRDNHYSYKKEHDKYLLEEAANAYTSLLILTKAFGLKEEKRKEWLADIEELVKLAGGNMKDVRKNANINLKGLKQHFTFRADDAGSMLKFEKEYNAKASA